MTVAALANAAGEATKTVVYQVSLRLPERPEELRQGMTAMSHNGLEKVLSGETTIDEVLRVSGGD